MLLSLQNNLSFCLFAAKREDEDYDEQVEEVLQDEVKLIWNADMEGKKCKQTDFLFFARQDENDVYILTKVSDVLHSVFSSYKEKVLPWFEHLLPLIVQLIVSVPRLPSPPAQRLPVTNRAWL